MAQEETAISTNMCMITDGERILVQDRKDPAWSGITFPGGHVEPGESFVESVRTNTAMLRRHLRAPELRIAEHIVGRQSLTAVDVVWLEGIADPEILKKVRRRLDEMDIDGLTVQTFRYTAGANDSVTYSSYTMTGESFFYLLEISTDYVSATDLVKCLQSLESIQLLDRNNRLDSRNKEKLRIAIAGNSFIGYSDVVQQLQRILNNNGKDATVHEYWYPNITITDFAHDAGKLDMLCGGDYDVLFINGAYTTGDADKLSVLEDACNASGTELVLFPAHNESGHNPMLAYRNTNVKMAFWRDAIYKLLEEGVPEADLIYYDGVLHSKPLAGYCGAVMIYGMLYETAPNTAAIGASYCGVSKELAQQVEDITMEFIRPYFE